MKVLFLAIFAAMCLVHSSSGRLVQKSIIKDIPGYGQVYGVPFKNDYFTYSVRYGSVDDQYPFSAPILNDQAVEVVDICKSWTHGLFEGEDDNLSNCLVLHIRTKDIHANLPVVVLLTGSDPVHEIFDSKIYEQDVVLVTVHHRVGPYGYLSTSTNDIPGNAAVMDIIGSLKWIQKYIQFFGGDANQVTLVGNYKTAGLIDVLKTIPIAHALFSQVVFQSGSPLLNKYIINDPHQVNMEIAKFVGCYDVMNVNDINKCFMLTPKWKLYGAYKKIMEQYGGDLGYVTYGGQNGIYSDYLNNYYGLWYNNDMSQNYLFNYDKLYNNRFYDQLYYQDIYQGYPEFLRNILYQYQHYPYADVRNVDYLLGKDDMYLQKDLGMYGKFGGLYGKTGYNKFYNYPQFYNKYQGAYPQFYNKYQEASYPSFYNKYQGQSYPQFYNKYQGVSYPEFYNKYQGQSYPEFYNKYQGQSYPPQFYNKYQAMSYSYQPSLKNYMYKDYNFGDDYYHKTGYNSMYNYPQYFNKYQGMSYKYQPFSKNYMSKDYTLGDDYYNMPYYYNQYSQSYKYPSYNGAYNYNYKYPSMYQGYGYGKDFKLGNMGDFWSYFGNNYYGMPQGLGSYGLKGMTGYHGGYSGPYSHTMPYNYNYLLH